MTFTMAVVMAVAGGAGASLRYLADNAVPAPLKKRLPWGTILINLSGSFLLGLVTGAATWWLPAGYTMVLGTGLLGGYTTFSTSSLETLRLLERGDRIGAIINAIALLVACVLLALAGVWLTQRGPF